MKRKAMMMIGCIAVLHSLIEERRTQFEPEVARSVYGYYASTHARMAPISDLDLGVGKWEY